MALFENFPYSNLHNLNLDWIIKITKDFLDQYAQIQDLISQGEESIQTLTETGVTEIGDLTTTGLQQLQDKADNLETLLQQWYDTHSLDIANQLALAIADLNSWYQTNKASFTVEMQNIVTNLIATIPADYTQVAYDAENTRKYVDNNALSMCAWQHGIYGDNTGTHENSQMNMTTAIPTVEGDVFYLPINQMFYMYTDDNGVVKGGGVSNTPPASLTTPAGATKLYFSVGDGDTDEAFASKDPSYASWFYNIFSRFNLIPYINPLYQFHYVGLDSGDLTDCNNARPNSLYILGGGLAVMNNINNLPTDYNEKATTDHILIDIEYKISDETRQLQMIIPTNPNNGEYWVRRYQLNGWTAWNNHAEYNKKIITVKKDGTGTFTKITDALAYAYTRGNTEIHVYPGTYDITDEIDLTTAGSGPVIGNDTHLIFYSGSKVVCKYLGGSAAVEVDFSPFNAGEGNFMIENMNIECKNVRYCVHDERGGDTAPYVHKYFNCTMKTDNSESSWVANQCIGGGLGKNGVIVIEGGYYESTPTEEHPDLGEITYHNNGGSTSSISRITVTNVYCKNSTIKALVYGTYTDMTEVYVSNCSVKTIPVVYNDRPGEYANNMELVQWNNSIHN